MTTSKPYRDLDWMARLAVMQALESAGSAMYQGHVGDGFQAAIGRKKFGATKQAMQELGFVFTDMHTFPLGTDKPPDHLRHDSQGIPNSVWLIAYFQPASETI